MEGTKLAHPEHGVVTADDPKFIAARKDCERQVFSQGVEIDGQRVTDPEVAVRASAKHLVSQVKQNGYQGLEKPSYHARLMELDAQVDKCVEANGWKVQHADQPKSAWHRRELLKLHKEGRIKLSPQEIAEYEKGLWW